MALAELIAEERRKAAEAAQADPNPGPAPAPPAPNPNDPTLWSTLKPAILPMAGNTLGTIAGGFTGPAAPFAIPTLEALGGMGGEYLNQQLGITEPSTTAIAAQGIIPPVFRGITAAKQFFPGATRGAQTLNRIAEPEAKYQLGKFAPESSEPHWAKVEASGQKIPTKGTFDQVMEEYMNVLSGSSGDDMYKGTRDYLTRLGNKLLEQNEAMLPRVYQKELRDLGAKLRGVEGSKLNDVEFGSLSRVKDKMEQALDAAPAGSDLATARHLYLKESVFDDLKEVAFKATKQLRGQGEDVQFNAAEVLRKIDKDDKFSRRFKAAFNPQEQGQIKEIFTLLNKLPALTSAQGVDAGSKNIMRDLRTGLVATGAAHALGTLLGSGISGGAAAGIGVAAAGMRPLLEFSRTMQLALQTHEGRKLLLNTLRNAEGKKLPEVMQKLAVLGTSIQPTQDSIREFTGVRPPSPFPNEP